MALTCWEATHRKSDLVSVKLSWNRLLLGWFLQSSNSLYKLRLKFYEKNENFPNLYCGYNILNRIAIASVPALLDKIWLG